MAAYMQMGHHTENLVGEADLQGFSGIVLSPMNRNFDQLCTDVKNFQDHGITDLLLDSQLYYPRTERQKLRTHAYFPDDMDTADTANIPWWTQINNALVDYSQTLNVNTVTSPVVEPRVWVDDYYYVMVQVANDLKSKITGPTSCLCTVMINSREMSQQSSPLRIASLVADTICDGYYIVFVSDVEPRREFDDAMELAGMLNFLIELKRTGKPVWISFCGSDMILFKCAGADHCCTGKFFNLRRFTRSRYEEPTGGGGQLPYWFEHSLLGFLREQDILRLQREGKDHLLGVLHAGNHWARKIMEQLAARKGIPWLGLAWRQYLSWFWQTELLLAGKPIELVSDWLKAAERNWLTLEDEDILLEEPRNDGRWLRPWRQALSQIKKPQQ
jgi:hypothetical protein